MNKVLHINQKDIGTEWGVLVHLKCITIKNASKYEPTNYTAQFVSINAYVPSTCVTILVIVLHIVLIVLIAFFMSWIFVYFDQNIKNNSSLKMVANPCDTMYNNSYKTVQYITIQYNTILVTCKL